MDLEQAARESGVVRPEHVDALLRSLKMRDFKWLVRDPSRTEERLQGDLLREMPIAIIDTKGNARSSRFTSMVMNNACDLQEARSEFITLAPVHDFKKFAESILSEDRQRAKAYLESVRANRIDEIIYIPNCPQLVNGGVVRLDLMSSISAAV